MAARSLIALLLVAGCASAGPPPPAPKPRRPQPVKEPPVVSATDCKPTVPEELPASVPYEQRSRTEAANLAVTGSRKLADAYKAGVAPADRERMVTDAVEELITALKADPYNVNATYALAGAYARIGRRQCSVNLLERLALLRRLPSFTPEVEGKVDRLLGRNQYRGALDHDFDDLRAESPFREVVKQLVAPL